MAATDDFAGFSADDIKNLVVPAHEALARAQGSIIPEIGVVETDQNQNVRIGQLLPGASENDITTQEAIGVKDAQETALVDAREDRFVSFMQELHSLLDGVAEREVFFFPESPLPKDDANFNRTLQELSRIGVSNKVVMSSTTLACVKQAHTALKGYTLSLARAEQMEKTGQISFKRRKLGLSVYIPTWVELMETNDDEMRNYFLLAVRDQFQKKRSMVPSQYVLEKTYERVEQELEKNMESLAYLVLERYSSSSFPILGPPGVGVDPCYVNRLLPATDLY